MTLKNCFAISLLSTLFFVSISCNQSQRESVPGKETKAVINEKGTQEHFTLSNKLYFLAPEFNSKECEAFGECDCCSSDYLFLDKENFICVDYCLDADTYHSGTYKIVNQTVELQYNPTIVVKEYNWEKETDSTSTLQEYSYTTGKCNPLKSVWVKFNCREKICFKTTEDERKVYVSINKNQSSESFLAELKKEGILNRLL